MKGFVYVLKCSNGKYYTGSTTNLEKRLWQHQNFVGSCKKMEKYYYSLGKVFVVYGG